MKTVYHYFGRFGEDFEAILKQEGIRYEIMYVPNDPEPIFTFDLASTSKRFAEQYASIAPYAKPLDVRLVSSAKETETAPWLSIIPHRTCIDVLNYDEAMLYYCTKTKYASGCNHIHNQEQIGLFRIRALPKKTNAAFYTCDTGFEFLFCDDRVFHLVHDQALCGVEFKPVLSKRGKEYDCLYQMSSSNIVKRNQIILGHGEGFSECPYCGSKQIVLHNDQQLHIDRRAVEAGWDFCMTESIFGEGIAHPHYLISQRFYQLLKSNRLSSRLSVLPIVLV